MFGKGECPKKAIAQGFVSAYNGDMDEKKFIREQIKEKPINKKKIIEKVCTCALCAVVFALVAGVVFAFVEPRMEQLLANKSNPSQTETDTESKETETQTESETEQVVSTELVTFTLEDYRRLQEELYQIGMVANKSIVTVTGVESDTDWFQNAYERTNQGSGIILKDTGTSYQILTERKNLASADKISVTFIDDSVAEATLLGVDGNTGLAVLSVDKQLLEETTKNRVVEATLGNSSIVSNGEMVIALGSPLGTNYSILVGNITSRNNKISTKDCNYTIFTTDIVANKDGSGVLINTHGEVVGIVMQDIAGKHDETTLTAVSVNELSSIFDLLSAGKPVPYLGLEISTVTDTIQKKYDIPKGVFVKDVALDSPGMLGGIQNGDIITSVNRVEVNDADHYSSELLDCEVGQKIKVIVERQNGTDYQKVTLEIEVGTK